MEKEAERLRITSEKNRWEPDFRELVEGLGDAIYTLDLQGRFTWGNEAGLLYLGYSSADFDEFLGTHFLDLLTPASKTVAVEHFSRGLCGEEISPFFEVQVYHRDGTILDFEIRASDLYRDGELIGRQGVVRHIGARRQLQGQITAKRQGLSESDIEILRLIAEGKTNREIAEAVHLSPHTIKDRVGRILKSMGAASRAEAAAMGIRSGLVPESSPPDQGYNPPPIGA